MILVLFEYYKMSKIIFMQKFILFLAGIFIFLQSTAQTSGNNPFVINKKNIIDSIPHVYKTKLFPSMIVPGILIGYGLTTFKNHGLYSSYQARDDIQKALGSRRSHVDDYL